MLFRVSLGFHLGFHSKFLWGFIDGFICSFFRFNLWFLDASFRGSCRGFLSGVLIRISLGFLWVSPTVGSTLGFHLGRE